MGLVNFVSNFAEQLEDTESNLIKANTKFRELDEWSSLTAMSIIAMVDEKYHIKLTGNDIRNSSTIEDIFNIVKTKK